MNRAYYMLTMRLLCILMHRTSFSVASAMHDFSTRPFAGELRVLIVGVGVVCD